jgi:hypothetical protein
MIKSKVFYAERVIRSLQNDYPNIDWKIDEREVFPFLDDVVNMLAAKGYLDNWKRGNGAAIDEQYITEFADIEIVDPKDEDGEPTGALSYLALPGNYVDLPNNRGIDEVYPQEVTQNNQQSVVVISHNDYRRYANNMAANSQGRLTAFVKGRQLVFTECSVGAKYGDKFTIRLVIRDASQIDDDAPYPIAANMEGIVVEMVTKQFYDKRMQPTDIVRDKNDRA